jgi:hypothetical protein
MNLSATYYDHITDLLLDQHQEELNNAKPGHCMKITGFSSEQLPGLLQKIRTEHPAIQSFQLTESATNKDQISPTKLIELRNKETAPLLILVAANSRTAAEDSYGNATFKDITPEGLEQALVQQLENEIPSTARPLFKEIQTYLQTFGIREEELTRLLLAWKHQSYAIEELGNFLHHLQLIPDGAIHVEISKVRSRLNFNRQSVAQLTAFNRSIFDRVRALPLEKDSVQKEVVSLFMEHPEIKDANSLVRLIAESHQQLNFEHWAIPELEVRDLRLWVNSLKSADTKNPLRWEDGQHILKTATNKAAKLKVRVSTQPKPKDFRELTHFRIVLMKVDGGAGESLQELRRPRNTATAKPYRDLTVELDPNMIEEGSYFLKVLAEDESGNALNADDPFKDQEVQDHWEALKKEDETASKATLNRKLTCDSEDFYFSVEEQEIDEPEEHRKKDKLQHVIQAWFRFRMEQFRHGKELTVPEADEETRKWQESAQAKLNRTFHFKYPGNHNYQINLSGKLIELERTQLKYADKIGEIRATLSNDATQNRFNSIQFSDTILTDMAPEALLESRANLYQAIRESAPEESGVLETIEYGSFRACVTTYLSELTQWTNHLKVKLESISPDNTKDRTELQQLFVALQHMDIIHVSTTLPNQQKVEVKLLSPLHLLRLQWLNNLGDLFDEWEQKTTEIESYQKQWYKQLDQLFLGGLSTESNPLILVDPETEGYYQYAGEITQGWGIYLSPSLEEEQTDTLTSTSRQIKTYLSELLNIERANRIDDDLNRKLIVKHLKNYLAQHPYVNNLVINLFNAGDAITFSDALVSMEGEKAWENVNYEIRLFKGKDNFIDHGLGVKQLLNPEYSISEEAEAFSQPTTNRLFPKLRFSINPISEYLNEPARFSAHISFLISPFPSKTSLFNPLFERRSFYLNALITQAVVHVESRENGLEWNKYISPFGQNGIELFTHLQQFTAGALAAKEAKSLPATKLYLTDADQVLLHTVHVYSDWVVTFDKNMGPEVYDLPGENGRIPFLLDYVPGEEVSGISSYLTTRPTSEIVNLLKPHFEAFGIPVDLQENNGTLTMLLEDLRTVSSSIIMQLNSGKNKAFEVIGAALTKRVLEKKNILENAFIIPIDLHQNLFAETDKESKSRADNLIVRMIPDQKIIEIIVTEIKCRKSLSNSEKSELRAKMKSQITNTIEAIRQHFDPEYTLTNDRLDRPVKNKELKSLLEFYANRANRYQLLDENTFDHYLNFLQRLDEGFSLQFKELGLVYDFRADIRHHKEVIDGVTFFWLGGKLIREILDPDSNLNTRRLEHLDEDQELTAFFGKQAPLSPFLKQFQKDKNVTKPAPPLEDTEKIDQPPVTITHIDVPEETQTIIKDQLGVDELPDSPKVEEPPTQYPAPPYDVLVGDSHESAQFGILGQTLYGRTIALDANKVNTISLFGVQGGGKSYTIGTITEMMLKPLKQVNNLTSPLAGVIFHYSETMDYAPEATSMIYPNDEEAELAMLKANYGAEPDQLEDVILLTPADKIEERKQQYPSIEVAPISFNSGELNVQDWMFLLGAIGNDATYIRQLKAMMRAQRNNLSLSGIRTSVENAQNLTNNQRNLALQRLDFAQQYIDDSAWLKDKLKPGRLIIVDLRDEFIERDEALGLFVIMLNIFSGVKAINGNKFNKFIVFDEAHKYMNNRDLTDTIVTAIREMRHKGVSIMIASQDPPSLPNEIIELSSIVLLHKFNSPQWLKHVQKSITPLGVLKPEDLSVLQPGEAFLWATKSTDKAIISRPTKIKTRPRVTKHGGATIEAI